MTENILKPSGNFSLVNALKDPKILPYFRSLSVWILHAFLVIVFLYQTQCIKVTDQPRERPTSGPLPPTEREKHVILSLNAPSPSHAADTVGLVSAIFPFIDSLSKINLRPETKVKLKKAREEVDKDLKEEAEREKKEEVSGVFRLD